MGFNGLNIYGYICIMMVNDGFHGWLMIGQ
jgi:hypothetical protein